MIIHDDVNSDDLALNHRFFIYTFIRILIFVTVLHPIKPKSFHLVITITFSEERTVFFSC